MKSQFRSLSLPLAIGLLSSCWGCSDGQGPTSPPPPITVAVVASAYAVQRGGTLQVTATVSSDPSNAGVFWSVSCLEGPCGAVFPAWTKSDVAATYTPPEEFPLGGLTVTVTAMSAKDRSKSGSAALYLSGVEVTVSPEPVTLRPGGTQEFTATVANDPTESGVTWALTQGGTACSPACGTISPEVSASGSAVTYTAPPAPPLQDMSVQVVATSRAYTPANRSVSVTVPAVQLSVAPVSALLPGGTTREFAITVNYGGINLALTQDGLACGPTACGALSRSDATPVTYTAPAEVSSPALVNLVATSAADTTKSASAGITLTNGTLAIVPYSLEFSQCYGKYPWGCPGPAMLTLTNTASIALSITDVQLTGANPEAFSIASNDCGATLAPSGTCTIQLAFSPSGVDSYSATLAISDSSMDSPQQVTLSGVSLIPVWVQSAVRSVLANSLRVAAPAPSGPGAVGTTTLDLVDPSREDPYLANGTRRELLVRYWYPASRREGCVPAPYMSAGLRDEYSRLLRVPLPEVRTNSCQNAPVADGVHPVVVFTPGFTAGTTDYTFISEDLASRGYVVAVVGHTYEATAVEFPDGRIVRSTFGSYLAGTARADAQALAFAAAARLQDVETVVKHLERLNGEADGRFAGKLDLARLALAGHSLGGLTAILGVARDARFRAAIDIDSGVPDDGVVRSTGAPVLLLAAGRGAWSPSARRLWNELRGPRLAVNFEGAEHVTPSDAVWLARGAVKAGSMGPEKTAAAIRDYMAAFLDTHLRGLPVSPLLEGNSRTYPDATVTLQDEPLRQKK